LLCSLPTCSPHLHTFVSFGSLVLLFYSFIQPNSSLILFACYIILLICSVILPISYVNLATYSRYSVTDFLIRGLVLLIF
jgi:hypothetical protein